MEAALLLPFLAFLVVAFSVVGFLAVLRPKLQRQELMAAQQAAELKRARQAIRFLGRANGVANTTFMDRVILSTIVLLFEEHFPDLEANILTFEENGPMEQGFSDGKGAFHSIQIRLPSDAPGWSVLGRYSSVPQEDWRGPAFIPARPGGQRYVSCIPLFAEESLVGVLLLRGLHSLTPHDQSVFFDVATQLASVVYAVRVRKRSSQLRDVFAKAVDPRVMEHLLARPEEPFGAVVDASVLFLDIRDFTRFSEHNSAEYVVARLNDFFMKMEACIRAEGGLINKFTGDGFLALFGVPSDGPDHAARALRAAVAMVASARAEPSEPGAPAFRIGVGIASGSMVCGTIGSPSRLEFTVIGDTVNAASRVESMNRPFGAELLVTRDAFEAAQAFAVDSFVGRFLGPLKLKGREKSLDVFEVLGSAETVLDAAKIETAPAFYAALEARLAGDLEGATQLFHHILAKCPRDGAAKHYLEERRQG